MAKHSKTYLGVLRGQSLTLRDVGAKLGLSASVLGMFERGERSISEATVRKYARAIGATEAQVRELHLQEARRFHERRAAEIAELLKPGKSRGRSAVAVG